MPIYNCKHSGDQYSITKFNRHGEVESSYLCDHVQCQCPAGVRDTCRHRLMLPVFLEHDLVNTQWFIDWDNGRTVVDFNGAPKSYYDDFLPATVQSNETLTPDLAPQALTDTNTPTQEQLYNRAVMAAGGSITTNYMQDGSIETFATLPHEPTPPRITPATPQWRRW